MTHEVQTFNAQFVESSEDCSEVFLVDSSVTKSDPYRSTCALLLDKDISGGYLQEESEDYKVSGPSDANVKLGSINCDYILPDTDNPNDY